MVRCSSSISLCRFCHSASATTAPSSDYLLLVGLGRVELPTSPLSGVRSNQLSYRPPAAKSLTTTSRRKQRSPRLPLLCPLPAGLGFPSLPHEPGGAEEVRTPDPLRAKQVLSQLSYSPCFGAQKREANCASLSMPEKVRVVKSMPASIS